MSKTELDKKKAAKAAALQAKEDAEQIKALQLEANLERRRVKGEVCVLSLDTFSHRYVIAYHSWIG